MRAISRSATVLLMLVGCAAGDGSSASPSRNGNKPSIGDGPSGATAGSSGSNTDDGEGFGNAQNPVAMGVAGSGPMEPACMNGEFCAPEGPDMGCGSLTLEAK